MNVIMELFGASGAGINVFTPERAVLALLLSFVLGQLAAWIYMYTHTGLSYSRTFVQSIILLTIVIALAMMVIGNNIFIAFGLIGALAVIRFRNILKDTRDTAFVFFALVIGMATGTFSFLLAIIGTLVYCLVLMYLHWSAFGSRHISDGFVRFHMQIDQIGLRALQPLLEKYCRSTHLVSQRFSEAGGSEVAYRLTMRDPDRADEMVSALQDTDGVSHVNFVLHEEQTEV